MVGGTTNAAKIVSLQGRKKKDDIKPINETKHNFNINFVFKPKQ